MRRKLSTLLEPPVFESEERTEQARSLIRIVVGVSVVVSSFLAILVAVTPSTWTRRAVTLALVLGLALAVLTIMRRGFLRTAQWLLVVGLAVVITERAFNTGGVDAPAAGGYVAVILIAGSLLGARGGFLATLLCMVGGLGLTWAEVAGLLPPPQVIGGPLSVWLVSCIWLGLAAILQREVALTLRRALGRARTELGARVRAQERMEESYAAVQRSEERMRRLVATTPAGLTISRLADGRFLEVNPEFERLFGWTRDEVIGRTSVELGMWPDAAERTRVLGAFRGLSPEGRVDREVSLRCKDGRTPLTRTTARRMELDGEPVLLTVFVDITDRMRAEEALRLSERKFGTIFRESPVALSVTDLETGRLVEVNAAFLDLVGASSFDEVVGRTVVEIGLLAAEDREELVRERLRGGVTHGFVWRGRRMDGEAFVGESSVTTYEIDGRRYAMASIADVTDRVRAEEERIRAEQQYRELFEGVRDVVFSVSADGLITTLNPAFERLTGMSETAWVGRPFFDLVHPADKARAIEEIGTALAGSPADTPPIRIRKADGSYLFGEINVAPQVEEGRILGLSGIGRDVTERVALEEARRLAEEEREESLRLLGERVKELNLLHQTARLFQRDTEDVRSLLSDWVGLIPAAWQHPECCEARITLGDVVVTTAGWRESPWRQAVGFAAGDEVGTIEVAYLEERSEEDEGPFLAEERALLESLAETFVVHLELRRHRESLEELVDQRTRELNLAKEEAEQANRAKGTFLATMSHEIRTPMNAVLGYAQLLRRDARLDEGQRRKVDTILTSGDHLLSLINNVLEMSRIEAGRPALSLEPMDLARLLEGIEAMFGALVRTKGIGLSFETTGDPVRGLRGDPARVRQVLINLLSNAVKFTERGGITVRTDFRTLPGGRCRVTVLVQDTGAGIAPEDLPRLFGAFEQLALGARTGGSGLGLAISRELARLMGGDLTLESTVGVGSTFTFTFEADSVEVMEAPPVEEGLPVGIRGDRSPRILVVDDRAENRDVARELLERVGFDTRTAQSGEEALRVHDAWGPELILMDLRMPGIGGLEAIRRLREGGSRAVLIAFTASSVEDVHQRSREVGADDVMLKPFREGDLLRAIGERLHLDYVYEADGEAGGAAGAWENGLAALPAHLRAIPTELRSALREAAQGARAARLLQLCDEVSRHSEASSSALRALVEDFRYDVIASALEEVAEV